MLKRALILSVPLLLAPLFASAQVIQTPTVPQPTGANQVVGANLQNPTNATIPAHEVTLGQPFVDGAVPQGDSLSASVNGQAVPTQLDVKTRYSDGSAKFGVITLMAPALAPNSTNPTMFSLTRASGSPISLATTPGYAFTVNLQVSGGQDYTFNVANMLAAAVANGTASYWRQGPVVSEARVMKTFDKNFRVVFDISKYADGSYQTGVQVTRDVTQLFGQPAASSINDPQLPPITYKATITQNGSTVYSASITHYEYEGWYKDFFTNGASSVNVQHDIAYLEKTGMIEHYSLTTGISANDLQGEENAINRDANWMQPFDVAGITQAMGATGDRGDLGPTTQANTIWLLTQNQAAAKYALGQGSAAAGIPWHFFNATTSEFFTTDNVPNIWTTPADPWGTINPIHRTPWGGYNAVGPTGWNLNSAHMPSLSFIPYLLTGNRFYLDQLNAQATWAETGAWPAPRKNAQGLILTTGQQTRGAAWSFRELWYAAEANPDGSTMKAYFQKMVNNSLTYAVQTIIPQYTQKQGEAYGWFPGVYGAPGTVPPWQDDYLISVVGLVAQTGNQQAMQLLNWLAHFRINSFLQNPLPHNGCAYNLTTASKGTYYTTWQQINAATAANGQSNGTGWAHSNGDYCALAMDSLAIIANTTSSSTIKANALKAYSYIANAGAPYTNAAMFQDSFPRFNVKPGSIVPPPPSLGTQPPSVTLSAAQSSITSGKSTTLTWSSQNANTCSGTGFSANNTSGSMSVSPTQTTTYTLTCTGVGGSASAQQTVQVSAQQQTNPPPPPPSTNPTQPTNTVSPESVSAVPVQTGGTHEMAIQGNYAYVTNSSPTFGNDFAIYNIANPKSITTTYTSSEKGSLSGIAVSGNYAYIGDIAAHTIRVVNVATPTKPSTVNTVGNLTPSVLRISGGHLYVLNTAKNALDIFSLSNPSSPSLLASVSFAGLPTALAVSGNYAYVTDNSNVFSVVNVSNASKPSVVGTLSSLDTMHLDGNDMAVSGSHVYLAADYYGWPFALKVIDVSNPSSPALVSNSTQGFVSSAALVASGNQLYNFLGGSNLGGLQVIDISNPAAPVVEGTHKDTSVNPSAGIVVGNYEYEVNTYGLEAFTVQEATSSQPSSSSTNQNAAIKDISVTGDFAQTNTCAQSTGTSGSCTISVTFKPTSTGTRTGTLSFVDSTTGDTHTIALSGTGVSNAAAAANTPSALSTFMQSLINRIAAFVGSETASVGSLLSQLSTLLGGSGNVADVSLSQSQLTFGSQAVGTVSSAQTITVTYGTNQSNNNQNQNTQGQPSALITASKTTITSGESTTLTWSSNNATSCSGTGFSANGTSGSVSVSPTQTTTYSIACSNTNGTSAAHVEVIVNPGSNQQNQNGTGFAQGTKVYTTVDLHVHQSASLSGALVGSEPAGSAGVINGGPEQSGGYTWYNVHYANGTNGWSVGTYLATSPTAAQHAPALTSQEINSIVSLLTAFGVDQATITQVRGLLGGQ